jgi:hypothetical protein
MNIIIVILGDTNWYEYTILVRPPAGVDLWEATTP